ncbi:hypothetical protein ACXGQW_04510 [Wenyingzhuangia sp. IMCC45533]
MKKVVFILTGVVILVIVVLLESQKKKDIIWEKTYNENNTNPYDLKVFYEQLTNIYPNKDLIKLKKTFYEHTKNGAFAHLENNNLYVNIDNQYRPDAVSESTLLNYIAQGNIAFISADYFSTSLTDSLNITQNIKNLAISQDSMTVSSNRSSYTYLPKLRYNQTIFKDSSNIKSIGNVAYRANDSIITSTNYVEIPYKKGVFYLHTQPEIFSNYYLLKMDDPEYVNQILSLVADKVIPSNPLSSKIYFESNYKIDDDLINSPLRFVKKNNALNLAWNLMLVALGIFLLLNAKRKQKIIPIIPPVKNTSLEFVETVTTLYEDSDNFQPIIHQKINVFYKDIRHQYNLITDTTNKQFIKQLSLKSGYDYQKTKDLIRLINNIKNRKTSSISLLLKLNKEIEEFYKKTTVWKN